MPILSKVTPSGLSATDFMKRLYTEMLSRAAKPFPGVIGYVDAVEVALCFGWIDSTLKSIDSGNPVQRFTPRRKGSNWCTINVECCKRLIAQEEMTEYGLTVIPEGLLS